MQNENRQELKPYSTVYSLKNPEISPEVPCPELKFFKDEEFENWQKLADQIMEKVRAGEPVAVSLVRCWNKNKEEMQAFAERFQTARGDFPELIGSMISINGNPKNGDKEHATSRAVAEVRSENDLPAVSTEVSNYSWSAGLNGPTALLSRLLKDSGLSKEELKKVYILNQSFDVEVGPEMSAQLSKAVEKGDYVFTIREEGGAYAGDKEKRVQAGDLVKKIMRDPDLLTENDGEYLKELARLCRNTGMLIPMADVIEMGGFSNACNPIGGMEDHDLYLRLLLSELNGVRQGRISARLKKILRAFANPVVYNDPAWNKMTAEGKAEPKIAIERNADEKIITRLRDLYQEASEKGAGVYQTPTEERDFKID